MHVEDKSNQQYEEMVIDLSKVDQRVQTLWPIATIFNPDADFQ